MWSASSDLSLGKNVFHIRCWLLAKDLVFARVLVTGFHSLWLFDLLMYHDCGTSTGQSCGLCRHNAIVEHKHGIKTCYSAGIISETDEVAGERLALLLPCNNFINMPFHSSLCLLLSPLIVHFAGQYDSQYDTTACCCPKLLQ